MILIIFLVGYILVRYVMYIENPILLISGSFLIGSISIGSLLYLLDSFLIVGAGNRWLANVLILTACLMLIIFMLLKKRLLMQLKNTIFDLWQHRISRTLMVIVAGYSLWLNYYTFHADDGNLVVRGGAWSDIMYHHAYIRSISLGFNVPTTYPYYANSDIHYHFMYDYLCGKLSQLGMNSVHAMNLMSSLSLICLLLLIYEFGRVYFTSQLVGLMSMLFMVFHSSASAFVWLYEHSIKDTINKQGWLNGVNFEVWGLFNFNVFINQRHLAFGLSFCMFLVLYLVIQIEKGKDQTCSMRLCIRDPLWLLGVFIGMLPYWNIVISVICLLFIVLFALKMSLENRPLAIRIGLMTIIAGVLAVPQFLMFRSGETVLGGYPIIHLGFEIEKFGFLNFIRYYWLVLGTKLIMVVIAWFCLDLRKRIDYLIFLAPFVIANVWQLGRVLYDNNKMILIWLMFANGYAAYIIQKLSARSSAHARLDLSKSSEHGTCQKPLAILHTVLGYIDNIKVYVKQKVSRVHLKNPGTFRVIATIAVLSVTLAGCIDFFAVINLPAVQIKDKDSELRNWVMQSTSPDSVFLTSSLIPYGDNAISAITLSGRMLYCVRNDVDSSVDLTDRLNNIKRIYTFEEGIEMTKELVEKENIDYILLDSTIRNTADYKVAEELLMKHFKLVYGRLNEYENQPVLVFSVE